MVEIWFNPLQINLGLKNYSVVHKDNRLTAFQRSSTLTTVEQDHNSHLGMHSMLRGIYMLLWDTNSLRDNLQTAADVKNKRGSSLFVPLYLFN